MGRCTEFGARQIIPYVGMRKFGVSKYLSYTKASTKESVDLEEVNDNEVGWEAVAYPGFAVGGC